jgi:hypothetical protein
MRIWLRHYERIVFFTHVRESGWARAGIAQLGQGYHRPSRCLTIAGLSGFLTLIQSVDRPDR